MKEINTLRARIRGEKEKSESASRRLGEDEIQRWNKTDMSHHEAGTKKQVPSRSLRINHSIYPTTSNQETLRGRHTHVQSALPDFPLRRTNETSEGLRVQGGFKCRTSRQFLSRSYIYSLKGGCFRIFRSSVQGVLDSTVSIQHLQLFAAGVVSEISISTLVCLACTTSSTQSP